MIKKGDFVFIKKEVLKDNLFRFYSSNSENKIKMFKAFEEKVLKRKPFLVNSTLTTYNGRRVIYIDCSVGELNYNMSLGEDYIINVKCFSIKDSILKSSKSGDEK